MRFRGVAELNADIAAWGSSLPADIDLVVGIPRSGMLAATLLSLHLNLALTDLDSFVRGQPPLGGARTRKRAPRTATHALILDDSVLTGAAMREARQRIDDAALGCRVSYAAVYTDRGSSGRLVDLSYQVLAAPRVFEWNVMHHDLMPRFCMSLDGVLCRPASELERQDEVAYEAYLRTAPALVVPSEAVGWLVASRQEQHRAATERWLTEHGVRYDHLVMQPDDGLAGTEVARKADTYLSSGALLYLEAGAAEAQELAHLTGRSVYSTDARQMQQPSSLGAVRRTVLDLPVSAPRAAVGYAHRLPGVGRRLRRGAGRLSDRVRHGRPDEVRRPSTSRSG